MEAKTITLRIELDPADDSLAGRAVDAGEEREFHGWLGLMGVIDALLDDTRATPSPDRREIQPPPPITEVGGDRSHEE